MAAHVKPCGCDCTAGPCGCIGCGITDCRQKSGFAAISGFSEFTSPSDPPKKYLLVRNEGSLRNRIWAISLDCAGEPTVDVTTNYSGDGIFDPVANTADCSAIVNGTCGATNTVTNAHRELAQTTSRTTGNGCGNTSGSQSRSTDGEWKNTLLDEDTEGAAIERAVSAITDWDDCAEGSSAFITDRTGTGDFAFAFRKVQVKAGFAATIGQTYKVTIKFGERPLGVGGDYIFFGLIHETTLTADAAAEETDWIDVPNAPGRESIAMGCSVELLG